MTDMNITGVGSGQGLPQVKPAEGESTNGFEDLMQEAIGKLSQVQTDSEKAVKEIASGGDPSEAIIAMEKADMNFQLMVEVRNKLITAYQQVMNMQM